MLIYNEAGEVVDDGSPLPVDRAAPLPWVDTTPPVLQNPDATANDIAAFRLARSVKGNALPVLDDRWGWLGPNNPSRPSYIMEPDLQETQGGMHLPEGLVQNEDGRFYYKDDPNTNIPMVRRPGLLPIANTPEGFKFAVPKLLDIVGNVMGNVGGPLKVATKGSEVVLGSGMVRNSKMVDEFPTQAFHGTSKPGFEKFTNPDPGQYMPDRALGIHVAKDPKISETFVKENGAIYPVKIPVDAKFLEVDQPLLPYIEDKTTPKHPRNVHSDQNQIEKLIYSTVYKKDPEMFARYLTQARAVPEADALQLAKDMVAGKSVELPVDGKTTFDKFIENFGGGKPYNEPDRAKAIEIFKKDMEDKGYVGLKYINTSPMETEHAKDATSYIVFDPHKNIQSKYTKTLMSETKGAVVSQVGHQIEKGPFYSSLERAVEGAKINLATPEQWLGYLKNQPGVKAEEIGIVLKDLPKDGILSKQQIDDIVKQNKVELKEKVLGDVEYHQLRYKDTLARRLEGFKDLHIVDETDVMAARKHNSNFNASTQGKSSSEVLKALEEARNLPKIDEDKLFRKYDSREEALKAIKDAGAEGHIEEPLKRRESVETKYHEYQLPGESSNYQETLFSLPEKPMTPPNFKEWASTQVSDLNKISKGRMEELVKEYDTRLAKNDRTFGFSNDYKAPHFDEHGTNLVAHARHNDRIIPGEGNASAKATNPEGWHITSPEQTTHGKWMVKSSDYNSKGMRFDTEAEAKAFLNTKVPTVKGLKSLHLEEGQSDLHQAGRDYGYKGEKGKLAPEFEKIEKKIIDSGDDAIMGNPDLKDALKMAVEKKLITKEEAQIYERYSKVEAGESAGKTVPDFPFKKNWEEVILKRMLHKAASEGYDALSWTPGEAQALRYQNEIRQKLNKIDWAPRQKHLEKWHDDNAKGPGVTHIGIDGQAGGSWLNIDKDGKVISASHKELVGETLDRVIGKDLAKQILEKPEGNIDAKGYVMGAEGMKQAYNKRWVDIINNLVKKYGGKVESVEIPGTIPKDWGNSDVYAAFHKANKLPTPNMSFDKFVGWWNKFTEPQQERALKAAGIVPGGQPIHVLKINDALRAKAKEGFSLFSSTPITTPVDFDPFKKDKQPKLTPVDYIPEF